MTTYEKIEQAREALASVNPAELDDDQLRVYCELSASLCDDAAKLMEEGDTLTDRIITAKRAFGHKATEKLYAAGRFLAKCQDEMADAILDNAIATSSAVEAYRSARGARKEFERTKRMMSIEKSLVNTRAKIDAVTDAIGRVGDRYMEISKKMHEKAGLFAQAFGGGKETLKTRNHTNMFVRSMRKMSGLTGKMSLLCSAGIEKCRAYEEKHKREFTENVRGYANAMMK